MKAKFFLILFLVSIVTGLSSCYTTTTVERGRGHDNHEKRIPPGHAKKMSGSKSAKHFAPGHNR